MPSYLGTMTDAGSDDLIPTGEKNTREARIAQQNFTQQLMWQGVKDAETIRNLRARLEQIERQIVRMRRLDLKTMVVQNALRLPGNELKANARLAEIEAERMIAWAELCGDVAPSFPTDGRAA